MYLNVLIFNHSSFQITNQFISALNLFKRAKYTNKIYFYLCCSMRHFLIKTGVCFSIQCVLTLHFIFKALYIRITYINMLFIEVFIQFSDLSSLPLNFTCVGVNNWIKNRIQYKIKYD